jgi:hypothetical protein
MSRSGPSMTAVLSLAFLSGVETTREERTASRTVFQ